MALLKRHDTIAGLFFMALALAVGIMSTDFSIGSAARMGPGYFPLMLAVILFGLGAGILLGGIRAGDDTEISMQELRAVAATIGAVVAFGFLLQVLGLVTTVLLVSVISSFGSQEFRWKRAAIIGAGLALFCFIVFSQVLNLRIPVLPIFVGYF